LVAVGCLWTVGERAVIRQSRDEFTVIYQLPI
jgi:hypothetical protein